MITTGDVKTLAVGAAAWSMAIYPVKIAGHGVATGGTNHKALAVVVGVGIAYATTPLLSALMGWKTQYARVRGIALALGAAQVIDGLVYIFMPTFYSDNDKVGLGCAGNIFFGAGLLGIFSAFSKSSEESKED